MILQQEEGVLRLHLYILMKIVAVMNLVMYGIVVSLINMFSSWALLVALNLEKPRHIWES